MGGHFMFDDDQETPNTLNCAFEFDLPDGKRKMLEFEIRHWITNHEAENRRRMGLPCDGRAYPGGHNTIGDIFYGSKGYLATGDEDAAAYKTWLGRDQKAPARMGTRNWQPLRQLHRLRSQPEEGKPERAHRGSAHFHAPDAPANASYRLGRSLRFDPENQSVIGDDEANALLKEESRGYRAPFVIPDEV